MGHYQYREIGEGEGWLDCSKEAYDAYQRDPHIDTRIKPMAEGCRSAISPCPHQCRDPYSICAHCDDRLETPQRLAPDYSHDNGSPVEAVVQPLDALAAENAVLRRIAQSRYELLRECQAEFKALGSKGLVETIETALSRS